MEEIKIKTNMNKLYVGDNLVTDSEDWQKVMIKYNEYEKKAKAFDLIVDHNPDLLKYLTGTYGSMTRIPMTKGEIEQVASAMGIEIDWVKTKQEDAVEEEPSKKKRWFR